VYLPGLLIVLSNYCGKYGTTFLVGKVVKYGMEKHPVKIQENGRVSIPSDVREELDVEAGDYVVITVERFEQ
jgi:AbrB family looped-hinge helix DNA binding protein